MKRIELEHGRWYQSKHGMMYVGIGMLIIRVFGYGLHVKDMRRHALLLSERTGRVKRLVIGPYSIKLLPPRRRPRPQQHQRLVRATGEAL